MMRARKTLGGGRSIGGGGRQDREKKVGDIVGEEERGPMA